jgi:hypothetical protein
MLSCLTALGNRYRGRATQDPDNNPVSLCDLPARRPIHSPTY